MNIGEWLNEAGSFLRGELGEENRLIERDLSYLRQMVSRSQPRFEGSFDTVSWLGSVVGGPTGVFQGSPKQVCCGTFVELGCAA